MKRILKNALAAAKKRLGWVVAAIVVVLLGWFFFGRGEPAPETLTIIPGEFIQSVSVSGTVTPAHSVEMGFAQSGRVTGVYVRVGQYVGAGTLIAQVENGDLRAAVTQREAAVETAEADLAALRAGTRPEEVAVAAAQVDDDERAVRSAIDKAYVAADDAVRNTTDQFFVNARVDPKLTFQTDSSVGNATELSRLTAEAALNTWQTALGPATSLADAVSEAHKAIDTVSQLLSNASAALARATPNSTVTQSTLSGYATDVGAARTTITGALSTLTSAESKLSTDRKTLALKQAGATAEDIAAQQARVKSAQADLDAARANLAKTLITAPFSGIVTRVDAKVGAIASQGAAQVAMISAGTFQIESYVPEINIAKLAVGDKGTVTLDAYGQELPFAATIISIDPAQTVRDGVSTYRSILQFDKDDERIRAGMTANIDITTERKVDTIAVPQGIVSTREGKKYVRVLVGNDDVVEREVTVGDISSEGNIEVLSGLSAGDVVMLTAAQ